MFLDIINNINNNTTNLFDVDLHPEGILLSISSGLHAPLSLPSAVETGEKQVWCFCERHTISGRENKFLCSYNMMQPEGIL